MPSKALLTAVNEVIHKFQQYNNNELSKPYKATIEALAGIFDIAQNLEKVDDKLQSELGQKDKRIKELTFFVDKILNDSHLSAEQQHQFTAMYQNNFMHLAGDMHSTDETNH